MGVDGARYSGIETMGTRSQICCQIEMNYALLAVFGMRRGSGIVAPRWNEISAVASSGHMRWQGLARIRIEHFFTASILTPFVFVTRNNGSMVQLCGNSPRNRLAIARIASHARIAPPDGKGTKAA